MMSSPGKLTAVCSVLTGTHNSRETSSGAQSNVLPKSIAQQSLKSCLESISGASPTLSHSTQEKTSTRGLSIQPITCVPSHWSLPEFRDEFVKHLPSLSEQPMALETPSTSTEWVVVNDQGIALGLLNQEKVWRSLALAAPKLSSKTLSPKTLSQAQTPKQDRSKHKQSQVQASQDSQSTSLRHVFLQRLNEAHGRIRNLTRNQWDYKKQLKFKDDLMAYISHEVKTPLTALSGLSQLLVQNVLAKKGENSDRQHLYAQLIHHSSHQLTALMGVLFDLVHVETKQLALSCQAVDLEALCYEAYDQAWEDYCLLGQPTEISFRREGSNTPFEDVEASQQTVKNESTGLKSPNMTIERGIETVVVDEYRCKRLLNCLYINALQLVDSPDDIQLKIETWGKWLAVHMRYQGIAIPLQQQKQIFQVLDIAEETSIPLMKGVGVRLLLALRLAEAHGGTLIWLSNESAGSEVTVLLPHQPVNTDASKLKSSLKTSDFPFIIIIDDEPDRIYQVFKALESLEYRVAIARSGAEALDKISCLEAKAIILNPSMDCYPGTKLLSVLQQTPQTQLIPIISITPIAAYSTNTADYGDSIVSYLQYPVDSRVLQHHLVTLTQPHVPSPHPSPPSPIILLYINPDLDEQTSSAESPEDLDLNTLLYPYHCRVIEVDNIGQADLLARVWHPDVLVFGLHSLAQLSHLPLPMQKMLEELTDYKDLAQLPIVTLTSEITEFAYSLDLHVFPCLDPLMPVPSNENKQVTSFALLQVIQLAAASSF
ncbi:MAG: histidine kinase dimerization/phospho-acceptor domain-containing protein [Cyanobacteria bacterium P01_F01_bin.150]